MAESDQDNTLFVDLEIDDTKAKAQNDAFLASVERGYKELALDIGAKMRPGFVDAERRALALQGTLKGLAQFDAKGKALDWITKAAVDGQAKIAGISRQLQGLSRAAQATNDKNLLDSYSASAKLLQGELDRTEQKIRSLQQRRLDKPAPAAESGGLGLPGIGAITGGVFAVTGAAASAYAAGRKAVDLTIEADRANRLLSSSASEAGKSYSELAAQNKEVASTLGLSNKEAASLTARFQQLATFSGKPGDAGKIGKAFSNLGAAKGISGSDLDQLVGTVLSGQDEGLNRLGLSDPGKIYDAFAKSIGTTADKLSQFQKTQALTDAVIEKSQIFSGAAKARMDSLEGSVAKTSATFENLEVSISTAFSRSKELHDFMESLSSILKQVSGDTTELQDKLSKGFNPADLAKGAAAGSGGLDAAKGLLAIPSAILATLIAVQPGLGKPFEAGAAAATKDVVTGLGGFDKDEREQIILRALNAQKLADAQQAKAAEQGKKDLADKLAAEKLITDEKARQDKLEKDSKVITKRLEGVISDPRSGIRDLQAGLSEALASPDLLKDAREALVKNFELAIRTMAERANTLAGSVREALVAAAGQDNPLVKLMADFDSASDRSLKKFGQFGTAFAEEMAKIERQQIQAQINQQRYENARSALASRQEATGLANRPDTAFGGFDRNLAFVGANAQFVKSDFDLTREADALRFLNKNPFGGQSFDQSRFGADQAQFAGLFDALDQVKKLQRIDLRNTGASGKGAVAEQISSIIPDAQTLLNLIGQGGAAGDTARQLLAAKSGSADALRDANRLKFQRAIENDQFTQSQITNAEDLAKLAASSPLDRDKKLAEVLRITGEVPAGELTPTLRQARIDALNGQAAIKEAADKTAEDRSKLISDGMAEITRQLNANGLKVQLGETPIVEIEVRDSSLSASQRSLGSRAGGSDVVSGNQ